TICLTDSAGNRHPLEKRVDVCRDFNRMLMFHFNHTLHVSLMHRRELLERAGGYREDVRVLIDWNLTRKLAFYTDFRHVEAVTGEYFVPIKDSDRISDVEREDEESYLANLRRIRADLPPEPWPEVRRVAVVVPVAEGDEAEADLLRYLCDKLDYPCRIVLADRSSDGAAAGRLPADLVDLEHIHTVRAGQGGVGAACAAGARAVEADLYMLIGPGLDPSAEQRLIRAVCYMEETGCAGVRWPEDDAWGRPFNVLIGRRAALGAAEPPTGEWPATETMPGDWVPPALESDYLLSFASRCEAEGDYESALHLLNDADAIQEGGTCTPYVVQRLARVAFAVGQYGQAERMCRRLIRAGYGADNCVRLGYICQSQDRWEEAVCAYREGLQMIGLDEEDLSSDAFPLAGPVEFDAFRAMAGLGECLVQMERDGEAAKVLRRAARLRADSLRPPLAFGRMFLRRGELDRAEEAFKLAAGQETRGRVTAVWVGLAEVCERRGQMTEAHRHWRTALDAAPQNEEFLEQAVRTGRGVVSAEELAGLYKEFLQYRPGHVPALVGLAELWLESGRHREARALLDRALLLSPEDERARSAATRLTA
ncbi:MAG: tetratricopeptide repeat protein, partial [Candidatus Brocadiia bacterium]